MRKALMALALPPSFAIHVDQSVTWLQKYLAINTVNPTGNEFRGVAFPTNILEKAKIPFETAESALGKRTIWARFKAGMSRP